VSEIEYATVEDDAEDVPADERCIWPGCTRRRAPGRVTGSGRQREYCQHADRPETGGGPVHNARNRWAWRRRDVADGHSPDGTDGVGGGGGEPGGIVRDEWPVSTAKLRAGELLDQARRQHAATLAAFAAERELYARVAEQFQLMADPASHDLEITAISLKAGRDISAAHEEVARAQRAQLAAERDRDDAGRRAAEADAAAEQFAADTEAAERVLAERTAELEADLAERTTAFEEALAQRAVEFEAALAERAAEHERAREDMLRRVRDAEDRSARASVAADAAKAAADEAKETADRHVAEAEARTAAARVRADEAEARADTAGARADAVVARADEAIRAAEGRTAAAEKRATAAHGEIEAIRGRLVQAEREAARSAAAAAALEQTAARAVADIGRLRDDIGRFRDERDAEVARLLAAHADAISAERARAQQAADQLDALRRSPGNR
jgi:hypothetical protein